MDAAQQDIKWLSEDNIITDNYFNPEWLKGPLLELEENELWAQLEEAYNNAIQ